MMERTLPSQIIISTNLSVCYAKHKTILLASWKFFRSRPIDVIFRLSYTFAILLILPTLSGSLFAEALHPFRSAVVLHSPCRRSPAHPTYAYCTRCRILADIYVVSFQSCVSFWHPPSQNCVFGFTSPSPGCQSNCSPSLLLLLSQNTPYCTRTQHFVHSPGFVWLCKCERWRVYTRLNH